MNLHAFVHDQQLHVDEAGQGWEWAVFHRQRDRRIKAGVATSLDAPKTAAAEAAEVAPETITWKTPGSTITAGAPRSSALA